MKEVDLMHIDAGGNVINTCSGVEPFGDYQIIPDHLVKKIGPGDNIHARTNEIRRKELLAECDWTQGPDSPLSDSDKAAWATYRQELRDITDQPSYPQGVAWPIPPSVL